DRVDLIQASFCSQEVGGPAALQALLAEAGRPMKQLEAGQWRRVRVGSAGATVVFSDPLGQCRLYRHDAPDLDLFPKRFGATTVHCGASYPPWLMRALRTAGWLHNMGLLPRPERLALPLLRLPWPPGHCAGLRVTVTGERHQAPLSREIELLAHGNATLLSTAPVLALLRRWQRGETVAAGARPCMDTPSFADIKSVLVGSGVLLSIV
ncbi:MAG: hypothetical protein ACYCQK_02940, partial [Acidiferrobacteraceae bacterium]